MKQYISLLVLISTCLSSRGQQDSIAASLLLKPSPTFRPALTHVVIPVAMIAYGFSSLRGEELVELNTSVKEEIWSEHPHRFVHADDYLQFAPSVALLSLGASGVQGRHRFREQAGMLVMTNMLLNGMVYPLKKITHEQRPDGSNFKSFPSGHTAEAFAGATLLSMEYNHRSIWYSVASYSVATATGVLRMYNNKHWLGDILAGAGIGILSAEASGWIWRHIIHHKGNYRTPY